MISRRRLLIAVLGLVLAGALPGTNAAADKFSNGAHEFVQSLADKVVANLAVKDLTAAERRTKFREILREHFDVDAIGKWVLGRYWRRASAAQQKEYLGLFEDLIVNTYAGRFRNYTGEKLFISNASSKGEKDAIVHSQILRAKGAPPIRVDWRVRSPGGSYKIVDVVVEGVSMTQTQRSEFGSVIRRSGGDIKGLLAALRDKSVGQNALDN